MVFTYPNACRCFCAFWGANADDDDDADDDGDIVVEKKMSLLTVKDGPP